jgi:NADH-quinone oxidoreductase subunit K
VPVTYFLVLSSLLFSIGVYGVLVRRNAVLVLLAVELMLNAANVNLIAFSALLGDAGVPGQVFTLFVIAVAAAEVGIGLAIVILIFRNRQSVDPADMSLMKW